MNERRIRVKIIRPTTGGLAYFKVSCGCCPRFLETHQRHAVAMFMARLHAIEEHPKQSHPFEPYLWDKERCCHINGKDEMCGYGEECHPQRHWLRDAFVKLLSSPAKPYTSVTDLGKFSRLYLDPTVVLAAPRDKVFMLPKPELGETFQDWAKRCAVINLS